MISGEERIEEMVNNMKEEEKSLFLTEMQDARKKWLEERVEELEREVEILQDEIANYQEEARQREHDELVRR